MLRSLGVLAVTCLLAGCTDTSSTLAVAVVPTLITVDPLKFRGAVPCGPGGLQSYVVVLTDVSDGGSNVAAVSAPTMCPNPTSFGSLPVIVGDFYTAQIDGYDRTDIQPSAPASRQMVDPAGKAVQPRWTTSCGEVPMAGDSSTIDLDAGDAEAAPPSAALDTSLFAPTQALLSTEVVVQGCRPLELVPPPSTSTDAGETDAASDEVGTPDGSVGDDSSSPPDATDALPNDASDATQNGG